MDDVELLRRRAKLPELIGAESWEMLPVAFGPRAIHVDVRGLEPEAMAVRGVPLAAGRGITREDVEHRRRVVVLGDEVRSRLLGVEGGLGSWVRIAGKPFKVVGLLAHVGTQLSRDRLEIDEQAWIPISTMQANWPRSWTDEFVVSKIIYRLRDRHADGGDGARGARDPGRAPRRRGRRRRGGRHLEQPEAAEQAPARPDAGPDVRARGRDAR